MTADPEALAHRIRQRDAAALAEFITLHQPQLTAFIQRSLGAALRKKVEPEDVLQEMSAEALRALPTAQLDQFPPFAWLCQVAERRIVDLHRKLIVAQKRSAEREVALDAPAGGDAGLLNYLAASMTTASQAFSREVREARLRAGLAQLPPEQREVLRLRYNESLPSQEIAQRIGKSDGAVRVMLTRALKRLQTVLEEMPEKD